MRRLFKTAIALVAGLALMLGLSIGAAGSASAAPSCPITYSKYTTVKKGTKGKQAKAAECLLKAAGFKSTRNSSFSATDVAAVKKFQKSRKISATGTVGPQTWTALLSRGSKPTLKYGKRSDSVKRLQRALTASGRKLPATGYFGPQTKAAVKSAQKALGLKQTGVATSSLWKGLQSGKAAKPSTAKAPKKTVAKKPAAKKSSSTKSSSSSKGAKALAFAKKQLGDSYRYGGQGPNSWDCSGLTGGAWKAAGVKLPRTSQAQASFGKKVAKKDLKPGDLVIFYGGQSHVAIYAGNGKVIHASQPGRPVAYIPMKYMPFSTARRPG